MEENDKPRSAVEIAMARLKQRDALETVLRELLQRTSPAPDQDFRVDFSVGGATRTIFPTRQSP